MMSHPEQKDKKPMARYAVVELHEEDTQEFHQCDSMGHTVFPYEESDDPQKILDAIDALEE